MALHKLILECQLGALCFQHGIEPGQPVFITFLRQFGRSPRGGSGGIQRRHALLLFFKGGQRITGFLNRCQHGFLVSSQRLLLSGFLHIDVITDRSRMENRPADAGAGAVKIVAGIGERRGVKGFKSDRTVQREFRIESRLGHADARRLRGKLPFRSAHVRAAAQQIGRNTGDRLNGGDRNFFFCAEPFVQRAGQDAGEHGQRVEALLHSGFKRRNGCTGAFEIIARLLKSQFADQSAFKLRLEQIIGCLLNFEIGTGDPQPLLSGTKPHITLSRFGGQRNLYVSLTRFLRFERRQRSFDGTAGSAEQINFPRRIESAAIQTAFAGFRNFFTGFLPGVTAVCIQLRTVGRPCNAELSAGGADSGNGGLEVAVFLQRLIDERRQFRIIQRRPPGRRQFCGLSVELRKFRRFVIRADRQTSAEEERDKQNHQQVQFAFAHTDGMALFAQRLKQHIERGNQDDTADGCSQHAPENGRAD